MWHESIVRRRDHCCTWAGILPGHPHLDRRTFKFLNQSVWLLSLIAGQRCLVGDASAFHFLRCSNPHCGGPGRLCSSDLKAKSRCLFRTAIWRLLADAFTDKKESLSCNTLSVPSCHAARRKHKGWDTARSPKPRQGESRDRGQVRTTDLQAVCDVTSPLSLVFSMFPLMESVLFCVVPLLPTLLLCYLCPYSKVEESFNIQAIHDIALLRTNISSYDHHSFPGVVPRTFIGSLIVYALTCLPLTLLTQLDVSKYWMQLLVRFALGFLNVLCFSRFVTVVKQTLGRLVAWRLMWITASQFHFFYYASRTLPNTFALSFVLLSLASLLRGRDKEFICLAGFAVLVFRSELLLFYGPCFIYGLLQGIVRINFMLILTALLTAFGSIMFWLTLGSGNDGSGLRVKCFTTMLYWVKTSPFHWYFTSALPRALLSTSLLLPVWLGLAVLLCRRKQPSSNRLVAFLPTGLILSALLFVLLYSWLPHKELRFIIYAVPIFNLAAALVWAHVETAVKRRSPSGKKASDNSLWCSSLNWFQRVFVWFCYLHLLVNLLGTTVLVLVSMKNYPGGEALNRLNHLPQLAERRDVHVHICNLAAQTGVTRFLEQNPHWIYNKTEHIENDLRLLELGQFTHLISEIKPEQMRLESSLFSPLFTIHSFNGIVIKRSWKIWELVTTQLTPAITVYERQHNEKLVCAILLIRSSTLHTFCRSIEEAGRYELLMVKVRACSNALTSVHTYFELLSMGRREFLDQCLSELFGWEKD
ncbi:hypothetical protein T265_07001 [Opisthorchis viverrini]|uniref:Mannosyltransferase n=1 Tax=Opisthorchis viverrini TaxID=6198 RepID=A0A074ZIB7_OPIVI|nr:hypothetical protein T265_07001 [Opisthorchis viverrini]KER25542.1 hypothetical protein T265_07001 [Opisthorchis viverrini]